MLSGIGIVVMAIPMLIVAVYIRCADPGPAIFVQRRVGLNKRIFRMHKFRSMKMDTPDIPTHLMTDPDRYIIKGVKFIRRYSIDELPQLFDIFIGNMSIIGPRPALWNQDDLVAERDRYGANDIKPGLTGWAQINGRDELSIEEKARLDGEYAKKLGFLFDCRCFFGTIRYVLRHKGVAES